MAACSAENNLALNYIHQTYPEAKDFELHNYHCHDVNQQTAEIFCCADY